MRSRKRKPLEELRRIEGEGSTAAGWTAGGYDVLSHPATAFASTTSAKRWLLLANFAGEQSGTTNTPDASQSSQVGRIAELLLAASVLGARAPATWLRKH
jgi:hypothetical protein